jgi:hypothetical protein
MTFRRCHDRFDRGEVVAVFAEGVSGGDRSLLSFKTGAARIALGYAGRRSLEVIPVGIHYDDRTAFRTRVVVSVGPPVDLDRFRAVFTRHPDQAVHVLTRDLEAAVARLIVLAPNERDATLVIDLEAAGWPGPDADLVERSRRIATWLECLRRSDPARHELIGRAAARLRRLERALRVPAASLVPAGRGHAAVLGAACLAGALPGIAGLALHALPWSLSSWVVRHLETNPTRMAFARLIAGLVFLTATYTTLAVVLVGLWRLEPGATAFALAVSAALGVFGVHYREWWRELRGRIRLRAIARDHRLAIARLRTLHATLSAARATALGTAGMIAP